LVARDLLRVIYAPHKVFKEIIKNPSYLGPMILLIIFVLAQLGSSYVVASKTVIEQTMPLGDRADEWTANALDWNSNQGVKISNNTIDFIPSTTQFLDNTSIEFFASNLDLINLESLRFTPSVNCGAEGFRNVSLRVKLISPDYAPDSVKLTLLSLDDSYFITDITNEFSNNVNIWTNLTLVVNSKNWESIGNNAVWENITGLKLDFSWSENSSVNMLVDGLFFRGIFKGPIELNASSYFAVSLINSITPFIIEWFLLTAFMYILLKILKSEVIWKPLLIAVGFSLIIIVIQAVILIFIYAFLPDISYPFEIRAGIPGEFEVANQLILDEISFVSNIGGVIQIIVYVWIVALGIFIVKALTKLDWMKSLLVSGGSLLLTVIVMGLLQI